MICIGKGNYSCMVLRTKVPDLTSRTRIIDDPYSLEQLKAPRMNISVVRPLVEALYETQDLSIGLLQPPLFDTNRKLLLTFSAKSTAFSSTACNSSANNHMQLIIKR